MTAPLTERQRERVKRANETVGLTAAGIAAGVRGVDLNSRLEVYEAAYGQAKDHLAASLAVIDELIADNLTDTRMVGEIRGVLAMFDGERALEAVKRIVGGER